MNSKVSFIITSYNYEKYIKQTIASVIEQTYQNWELIIVDDGSKDNSVKIINDFVQADERITLYQHSNNENRGLIESIKLGIEKTTGDFIVFLESDDYITKDYLEKKLSAFQKYENIGLVYNDINLFGEDTDSAYYKLRQNVLNEIKNYWMKNPIPHNVNDIFYLRNIIPTFSCVMLKKELLDNCDYNSPHPAWTDWWIWAQISNKTNFFFINEKLTFWRVHKNSFDSKKHNKNEIYNFYKGLHHILKPIKTKKYKILVLCKSFLRAIKYGIKFSKGN